MTTFDTNNQVSGIYAAQPFSGKVTDVTVVGEVTYLTIQLDAPIEVWAKGTLSVINMEVDSNGVTTGVIKGNVVVLVAKGTAAAAARERVVIKRALRGGVTAEFANMILMRFDMNLWHHSIVAEWIIYQWSHISEVA